MWHSAVGSRTPPPTPPCMGAICWEPVYSVQAAQRRRVHGCVSRLFLSWGRLGSLQVHLYVDCTCVSVTYVSVQRARANIHVRARCNLFMCHFVCWCSESGCNFSKLYTEKERPESDRQSLLIRVKIRGGLNMQPWSQPGARRATKASSFFVHFALIAFYPRMFWPWNSKALAAHFWGFRRFQPQDPIEGLIYSAVLILFVRRYSSRCGASDHVRQI